MDSLEDMIKQAKAAGQVQKESDFVQIFKYFLSPDGIMGKTKITKAQRNMLYVYGLQHAKHPNWGLETAAQRLALLFISEDGQSRTQSIELFQNLLSKMREESVSMTMESGQNPPKDKRF